MRNVGTWMMMGFAALLLLLPALADASECASDVDCGQGQVCLPLPCAGPAPCEAGESCPEPEPCESVGECVEAWGSSCASDADCGEGWVCEVIGASSCATPVCPEGESCPEVDCVDREIRGCVPPPPPPCTVDADCAADAVCVSYTWTSCSGGGSTGRDPANGSDSGGSGAAPAQEDAAEPTCEEQTEGYCVPRWVAPCEQDADCGSGFACRPLEVCTCDGGGATPTDPGSGGGTDSASGSGSRASAGSTPEESACSCEPAGSGYCEIVPTACTADADCGAGWSCMEQNVGQADCASSTDPAVPEASGSGGSEPASDGSSGAGSAGDCGAEDLVVEHYCAPPDWYRWTGSIAGGDGATSGEDDASSSPYESAVGDSVGAAEVLDQERATPPANGQTEGEGQASKRAESGCSVAASAGRSTAAGLGALLLLGLVGLVRRRR